MDFHEFLKQKREESGIKQEDIAKEIGLSVRAYQYYEEGRSLPKAPTLKTLSELLKFDIAKAYEQFVPRETEPNSLVEEDEVPFSSKKPDHPLEPALLRIAEGLVELAAAVRAMQSNTEAEQIIKPDNNALSALKRLQRGIGVGKGMSDKD